MTPKRTIVAMMAAVVVHRLLRRPMPVDRPAPPVADSADRPHRLTFLRYRPPAGPRPVA